MITTEKRIQEFKERWQAQLSSTLGRLYAMQPAKLFLRPFTYEDRHFLRNKWITKQHSNFESAILSIEESGIKTIDEAGRLEYVTFWDLALKWRFINSTPCGHISAHIDPSHNNL